MRTAAKGDAKSVTRRYRTVVAARLTWGLSLLLVAVYLGQLALAGSLDSGAAYTVVENAREPVSTLLLLFSYLLHSSHAHLLGNLLLLGIFGPLVEARDGAVEFLGFVVIVGMASNAIGAPLVDGGASMGISGVGYALLAREAVYRVPLLGFDRGTLRHWVVYAVAATLVVYGLLHTQPGASFGGHLTGVVVGAGWELVRGSGTGSVTELRWG